MIKRTLRELEQLELVRATGSKWEALQPTERLCSRCNKDQEYWGDNLAYVWLYTDPALTFNESILLSYLYSLRNKGRQSKSGLSKLTGFARSTIAELLQSLQKKGVLKGYTVNTDWKPTAIEPEPARVPQSEPEANIVPSVVQSEPEAPSDPQKPRECQPVPQSLADLWNDRLSRCCELATNSEAIEVMPAIQKQDDGYDTYREQLLEFLERQEYVEEIIGRCKRLERIGNWLAPYQLIQVCRDKTQQHNKNLQVGKCYSGNLPKYIFTGLMQRFESGEWRQ